MNEQPNSAHRKAVVYVRCACQDDHSLKEQTKAALALAAEHGITVCEVVTEYGSGLQINTGLQELLDRVDAGEIDQIISVNLHRIARDMRLCKKIIDRMSQMGTSLIVGDSQ